MAKRYRPVRRDQQFLLPVDMGQWLPEEHLAWFLIDVVEQLDLSGFEARAARTAAGPAAYEPRMLLTLLLYGYAVGPRSSRVIERLCHSDAAFRVICAMDAPDHSTIARFRQRQETDIGGVFAQVLVMCRRLGLGRVGVVAVDGTKIAANASKGANRGEEWVREEAARIVAEAGAVDAAEDEMFGADRRGDEMPPEWSNPRSRPGRIRRALGDLAAEAAADTEREQAEQAAARAYEQRVADPGRQDPNQPNQPGSGGPPRSGRAPRAADPVAVARARVERETRRAQDRIAEYRDRAERAAATGRRLPGTPPNDVDGAPAVLRARAKLAAVQAKPDTAVTQQRQQEPQQIRQRRRVRNVTDPDSRLMPTSGGGWVQGYNAQLAVSDDQIILATTVSQHPGDVELFTPMLDAAQAGLSALNQGRPGGEVAAKIGVVVADAGYLSTDNLTGPGPDRLIGTGKRRDIEREARDDPATADPPEDDPRAVNAHRLRTTEGLAAYRRRGVTVEPVNGHLKDGIGLRRFARRGLGAAASELQLAATVANLLKMHRAVLPQP